MFSALQQPTPGAGREAALQTEPRPAPTSLPLLDGPQGQRSAHRQEVAHLDDEGLLALHRELAPGLGPGQGLLQPGPGTAPARSGEHPLPMLCFEPAAQAGYLEAISAVSSCSSSAPAPAVAMRPPAPSARLRTPELAQGQGLG